jgi:hypothetical protein
MTRQILSLRATLLAVASFFFSGAIQNAHAAADHTHKHMYKQEIDALEDQWKAAILSGNTDALGKLLSDDFTAITANGTIQNKHQYLDARKNAKWQMTSLELTDLRIRFYGSTAVVTTLAHIEGIPNPNRPEGSSPQPRADGSPEKSSFNGFFRYTQVFSLSSSDKWTIVSFEASRVRDPNDRR